MVQILRCGINILTITLLVIHFPLILGLPSNTIWHDSQQHVLTQDSNDVRNETLVAAAPQPFYAIAHRVLTAKGARDAIGNGANALEIDCTAWKKGWWADHDGSPTSAGDSIEKMFETIVELRKEGKTITFVWLDIKNPDWCDPDDSKWRLCSIDALRDQARRLLIPNGVHVLYGFYEAKGKAYKRVRGDLADKEALNLNGMAKDVVNEFSSNGPSTQSKRVMSYGYFNLPFEFGDCTGNENTKRTCTQLKQGVDRHVFGKVFGWTSAKGHTVEVDRLLNVAGIDGLIYGFQLTHYYDHEATRAAAHDILRWIETHPDRRYLAKQDDRPW